VKLTETINANPISVPKTLRHDRKRVITSANAGKIIPLAYVPLLREDRVSNGQFTARFEMMETAEMLLNAVNVTVYAHFVPFLASDRFNGMDQLNRSYKGEPETEGGSVVPFIQTMAFAQADEIWKTMGIHAAEGALVNAFPVEAYNIVTNFRRKARSEKLAERTALDTTLATAFWRNTQMAHIVPDFDQAMIDGEVELQFADSRLPVRGLGVSDPSETGTSAGGGRWSGGLDPTGAEIYTTGTDSVYLLADGVDGVPDVFAELLDSGVKVSLQNIELAKQTAAFAKLRERYNGMDDEWIIDLLMDGVRVPEEALSQPILLDRKSTIMGYSKRYATDAGNLDQSVTNGETFVDLRLRTPPMNTGGIILITAEIVPEQLFERQKDYFLHASDVAQFPSFLRDFLDPEKVEVVQNNHVDVEHSDPDGTFGYAPLNHGWKRDLVNVGGRFYRPDVDAAFDEDRQRFWAVETPDPELTEDFYLATTLHNKVFADTTQDGFEITLRGACAIIGNTVFGKGLAEDTGDYEAVAAQVDDSRIQQEEGA
jgi:hypothetical protein